MAQAVNMPQVGQDIESARILEWLVEVGQEVSEGDILATVESDKANFEVEAFHGGTILALLYQPGEEAAVFQPIAYIGSPGDEIPAAAEGAPSASGKLTPPVSGPGTIGRTGAPRGHRSFSSPSARRRALEAGIELGQVKGSGPGGRIINRDVEAVAARGVPSVEKITPLARKMADDLGIPPGEIAGSGPGGKVVRNDVTGIIRLLRSETLRAEAGDRVVPFERTRKRAAEKLSYSNRTVPHFYLFMDVDMSIVLKWRTAMNETGEQKISINDMIAHAAAAALVEFPDLNAHVDDEKVLIKPAVNLGIAVATEAGLLVPVIEKAEQMSLQELSRATLQGATDARRGVIRSTAKGSFTITNLGMHGITRFLPIINPPECAILSVGGLDKKAVPDGAKVHFRDYLSLGLACDHRAVDGDRAARFLGCIKEKLENNLENLGP